jgi:hypothetical protein
MAASSRPLIVCLSSSDSGLLRYRQQQQLMEWLSHARNTWDVRLSHIVDALADIGITLAPSEGGAHTEPSEFRGTVA